MSRPTQPSPEALEERQRDREQRQHERQQHQQDIQAAFKKFEEIRREEVERTQSLFEIAPREWRQHA